MIDNNKYDEEYFESGLATGKSCYLNYRWLPELTIKMAHNIIRYLDLKENEKILDYGCAKGYLVKAFRILDIEAYGCDISSYAIDKVDAETREYCKLIRDKKELIPFDFNFDWIMTKDVLEHLEEKTLDKFVLQSYQKSKKCFHVIPLSDESNNYIVPEYALDETHVLMRSKDWWIKKFESFGWKLVSFDYKVRGVKENWTKKYEKGNGFFIFEK